MDVRSKGGFTAAEGCMFGAVGLFVILLIALVYIAFLRFDDRPTPEQVGRPRAMVVGTGGARG